MTTLNEGSNNTTISVKPGETVKITLPGNPTTGYMWTRAGHFDKEKADNLSCDALNIKKEYKATATAPGMCGGGGHFDFEVAPKTAGKHKLELVYARPWEGASSAAKNYTLDIDCAA